MGLAASQARLISLQARMSDLEYEGQQINQQRQTLTNKMNEVYAAAMDMEVPTAPSKIDFQIDAYSGKIGAQKVDLKMNDQGNWVGTITKPSMTAGLKFTAAKFNGGAVDGTIGDDKEFIKANRTESATSLIGKVLVMSDGTSPDKVNVGGQEVTVNKSLHILTASDIDASGNLHKGLQIVERNPNEDTQAKIGDHALKSIPEMLLEDNSDAFTNAVDGLKKFVNERHAAGDPKFPQEFNEADFRCYKDDNGNYQFTPVANTGYNAKDIANQPALITSVLDKEAKVDVAVDSWEVDNSGNITAFVIKDDEGTLSTIKVEHNTQAFDEIRYDEAMRNYERDKNEYDKAQNDFNHQTSIYQRQDKQLELKLTRLDNERNALNTEIDSVKKVIQDASEKGFKTFSG